MTPTPLLKRLIATGVLSLSLAVGAFAQQKTSVVYVNATPPANNPNINTNSSTGLSAMTNHLNAGAAGNQTYQYNGSVNAISSAVQYANSHPTENVVVVVHGVYDKPVDQGGTFQNKVADTNGETRVADLPNAPNVKYYYCGMNGDNKEITVNDIGNSQAQKNHGTFQQFQDSNNRKQDISSGSTDDGAQATASDDAAGDEDPGTSGSAPDTDGSGYEGDAGGATGGWDDYAE